MALPFSVSQAVDIKEVPRSFTRSPKPWLSADAATLPSDSISWKNNAITGFRPPIARRLHRAVRDSKENGVACIAGSGNSDAVFYQSCNRKQLLRKSNAIAGLLPPSVTRLQRLKTNSTQDGIWCSADFTPSDVAGALSSKAQQQATLQQFRRARIIACLRTSSSNLALDAARAALDGGLTVLEVTMTTPSAAQVIKVLVQEYPSAIIGAGTVLSKQEADTAKDAGAKFLMSPVTEEELVCAHKDGSVVFIPGAMTPTEVIRAYNLGASVVKLYPVALVGGVRFVAALSRPLSHVPLIASHGVTLDMVESYTTAGATAVILSDAIFDKSALESKDLGRIRLLASAAASKAASCLSNLIST